MLILRGNTKFLCTKISWPMCSRYYTQHILKINHAFILLHNTSQIIISRACAQSHNNKSSTSGPMLSTMTIFLVHRGLCPTYNHIQDNKTCALAHSQYIYLINITHVQWGIHPIYRHKHNIKVNHMLWGSCPI